MTSTRAIVEEKLWQALGAVLDPDLGVDIVNLGLVYELAALGGAVLVRMTLTSPACPLAEELEAEVVAALRAVEGVGEVRLEWTFDPPWSPSRLTEEGRDLLIALGYL